MTSAEAALYYFKKAARIMRIRRRVVQRWSRRLDKWAVASCGPPVAVLPCRHCGERFGCDCEDWPVMMAGEAQNETR